MTTTSQYHDPERRHREILDAAVRLSEQIGYLKITGPLVAIEAECGYGSINGIFESMEGLRRAVVEDAIANKNLIILAQFMTNPNPDPNIKPLSPSLKKTVAAFLAG